MEKFQGFTLIETLITLALAAIIIAAAAGSFIEFTDRRRLESVTEALYTQVKFAQTESLRKRVTVYVSITPGTNWCVGVSDTHSCNCTTSNDCTLDGAENVISNANYNIDNLGSSGMTVAGGIATMQINGLRGTFTNSGTVTVNKNNKTVNLNTNAVGAISKCTNSISSYPTC